GGLDRGARGGEVIDGEVQAGPTCRMVGARGEAEAHAGDAERRPAGRSEHHGGAERGNVERRRPPHVPDLDAEEGLANGHPATVARRDDWIRPNRAGTENAQLRWPSSITSASPTASAPRSAVGTAPWRHVIPGGTPDLQ